MSRSREPVQMRVGPRLALLLRLGRHYPHKRKTWTKAHLNWLASQKFEYPQQRFVFEEMMLAIRQAQERLARLEEAIRGAPPERALAAVATASMAHSGIDLHSAGT